MSARALSWFRFLARMAAEGNVLVRFGEYPSQKGSGPGELLIRQLQAVIEVIVN
ncbi:MAG: hypothetical protein ACI9W2_005105 [Gammaproteobacteria bacterium]|jgi:hypothetical protein